MTPVPIAPHDSGNMAGDPGPNREIQEDIYVAFSEAYSHFNSELFEGRLPDCIFVFQRSRRSAGHFIGGIWHDQSNRRCKDEIALNPDRLKARSLRETLSTLVHEMTHLEQHHFGSPGQGGYHNREWTCLMVRIGLVPSDTGAPGGKMIGRTMSHYIKDGGAFDLSCRRLEARGFRIPWTPAPRYRPESKRDRAKRASKTRFFCPSCTQLAWAKPTAQLLCGECELDMIPDAYLDL